MSRDIEYEKKLNDSNSGGRYVKCRNFILCETMVLYWFYSYKTNYVCENCCMNFMWKEGGNFDGKGYLKTYEHTECWICLEEDKISIEQPWCEHTMCIDCFKRCYCMEDHPKFPYPELEPEYFYNVNDVKWTDYEKYPLMNDYKIKCDEFELKYANENLRCCPLCRK
jgi:hypothetical protein